MTYEEKLEKFKFFVYTKMNDELLETPELEMIAASYSNDITIAAKYTVWGQRIGERVIVKHPIDWKEAIKERFAPGWLLNRYPVRYSETVLDLAVLFPKFRAMETNLGNAVYVNMSGLVDYKRTEGIEYVDPDGDRP